MPITGGQEETTEPVQGLPLGVDPHEQSSPEWTPGVHAAPAPARRTATQPFNTKPGQSVPVWQRASSDLACGLFPIGVTPIQFIRKNVGRSQATVWVPGLINGSAPNGVMVGPDPGPLSEYQVTGSFGAGLNLLNSGDSVTYPYEGSLWAICLYQQTLGYVQFQDTFNPPVLDPSQEY